MAGVKSKTIPTLNKADIDRYWSHVHTSGDDRGCWNWTGSTNSKGYGRFHINGQHYYAHRLSWHLVDRETPSDMLIYHTCDNPQCVNPHHLMMGDIATNNRDAKLKRNLKAKRAKITKPKDFPLTYRKSDGRWCRKIKGKTHYFVGTREQVLEEWLRVKDDLLAGRTPAMKDDRLTVLEACDRFLVAKRQQVDAGELKILSWQDYKGTCDDIVAKLGKTRAVLDLRAEDFESIKAKWSKTLGIVAVGGEIQRTRVWLKYLYESGLIDRPVRVGPLFKRADKKTMRKYRASQVLERGRKMFEAAEIRDILAKAGPALKAMVMLAINAGLGNSDVAGLPLSIIKAGWLDFPRPKTGVERRCPLWRETQQAIDAYLAKRPKPKTAEAADMLFVTKYGEPWIKENSYTNPVSQELAKVLKELNIHRHGVNFYSLRHTFRTIAGGAKDEPAINRIMGHSDDSMGELYTESIEDERLIAVTDHVRRWLFPVEKVEAPPKPAAAPKQAKRTSTARVVRRTVTTRI